MWAEEKKSVDALRIRHAAADRKLRDSGYFARIKAETKKAAQKRWDEELANADKARLEADQAEEERLDKEEKNLEEVENEKKKKASKAEKADRIRKLAAKKKLEKEMSSPQRKSNRQSSSKRKLPTQQKESDQDEEGGSSSDESSDVEGPTPARKLSARKSVVPPKGKKKKETPPTNARPTPDMQRGKKARKQTPRKTATKAAARKEDDSNTSTDSEEDSDEGGGPPPARKTPRSASNPHEQRKRKVMKRYKPGLFRQNTPRPKKKNKRTAGMTNPVVQKVLDKAIRDDIVEPDQMANNYMNTKFPDAAPLTFLGDNNINSKKWRMDSFNAHQLDYDKALEDANNRLGIETAASVTKAVDESYIGNWPQGESSFGGGSGLSGEGSGNDLESSQL